MTLLVKGLTGFSMLASIVLLNFILPYKSEAL